MDIEHARHIEAKMKLEKEECPYLHGDICMDGTNICRCFFDCSDDCKWVREKLGKSSEKSGMSLLSEHVFRVHMTKRPKTTSAESENPLACFNRM